MLERKGRTFEALGNYLAFYVNANIAPVRIFPSAGVFYSLNFLTNAKTTRQN